MQRGGERGGAAFGISSCNQKRAMKTVPCMVIAGEFWAGGSERGLAEGFRAAGWAVHEIDVGRFTGQWGRSVFSRGLQRVTNVWSFTAYADAIANACESLRPDVFMTIKGLNINAGLLDRIKRTGATTVLFYPDVDFEHRGVFLETLRKYDNFVTTKSFHRDFLLQHLRPEQISFVHHGYSSGLHQPPFTSMSESDYTVDILHVGNHSAYKEDWLALLAQAMPEAVMRIVGNNWNRGNVPVALRPALLGYGIVGIGYPREIQLARINVAVHYGPTASSWQDKVSTRTFEIPACRGFMLHVDNDEVRELFEPGVEIDVFSTPEELIDKTKYYLARPDLRRAMIERAWQRAVPAYSYDARAGEILATLGPKSASAL